MAHILRPSELKIDTPVIFTQEKVHNNFAVSALFFLKLEATNGKQTDGNSNNIPVG